MLQSPRSEPRASMPGTRTCHPDPLPEPMPPPNERVGVRWRTDTRDRQQPGIESNHRGASVEDPPPPSVQPTLDRRRWSRAVFLRHRSVTMSFELGSTLETVPSIEVDDQTASHQPRLPSGSFRAESSRRACSSSGRSAATSRSSASSVGFVLGFAGPPPPRLTKKATRAAATPQARAPSRPTPATRAVARRGDLRAPPCASSTSSRSSHTLLRRLLPAPSQAPRPPGR